MVGSPGRARQAGWRRLMTRTESDAKPPCAPHAFRSRDGAIPGPRRRSRQPSGPIPLLLYAGLAAAIGARHAGAQEKTKPAARLVTLEAALAAADSAPEVVLARAEVRAAPAAIGSARAPGAP